jgi:hypothetical protein
MRIVIAARPYNPTKGGPIVLHKLCDSLLRAGMDNVYMRPDKGKFVTCNDYKSQVTDYVDKKDIVIYHNSTKGNPWNARKFIRWMLYRPTNETDGLVLYYSKQFGDGPVLKVIEPFLDTFYDKKQERSGECWTWRKAQKEGHKTKPSCGVEIPRGVHKEELAEIFNRHKTFTSYDGATFLSVQAALCGCDSIIKNPVGGTYPWPGVSYLGKSVEQARGEHALLRETLEKEYKEQDIKAAEVIKWAMKQF